MTGASAAQLAALRADCEGQRTVLTPVFQPTSQICCKSDCGAMFFGLLSAWWIEIDEAVVKIDLPFDLELKNGLGSCLSVKR